MLVDRRSDLASAPIPPSTAKMGNTSALAPLVKLLTYARMYSNKNTTLFFLKGRNATTEIDIASKAFFFEFEKINSLSSDDGCVLKINNIRNKNG